jgi:dTDP-4-amino-4,6-dideoxygalactose transaminase
MVVTNREDLAERVLRLRNHGAGERYHHLELGWNSRLDEIQAALLRVKLRHLHEWVARRRQIAARFGEMLAGLPVALPKERPPGRHAYHQYTLRSSARDALAKALADLGVGTALHYPLPLPAQPLFRAVAGARGAECPRAWQVSREVLSLPCFPELTGPEIEAVGQAVRRALERI